MSYNKPVRSLTFFTLYPTNNNPGLPSSLLPGTRPRRRPLPTPTIPIRRRRSQRLLQPRWPRRLPPTSTKLRISSSSSTRLRLRIAAAPGPANVLSTAGLSATAAGVLSGSRPRRVDWGGYLRGYYGGVGVLLLLGFDLLGGLRVILSFGLDA